MRSKKRVLRTLLIGMFFPLASGAVSAQTRDSSELRPVLKRAQIGNWYVRIRLDTDTVLGRVRFVRDSVASVGQSRVRFREVQSLDRRARQGGVAAGSATAGGLLFGSVTFLLSRVLCDRDCSPFPLVYAVPGFSIGAVFGGLFGYATDPGTSIWIPVWPDPSATPARVVLVDSVPPRRGEITGDSVPKRSPKGVTTFGGALIWQSPEPNLIPSLFGVNVHRDVGNFEVIPLSFSAAIFPAFLGAQTGINYRVGAAYVGAAGGAAVGGDTGGAAPVLSLRLGAGDSRYSPIRVEALLNTFVSDGFRPFGFVVLGYTVRGR